MQPGAARAGAGTGRSGAVVVSSSSLNQIIPVFGRFGRSAERVAHRVIFALRIDALNPPTIRRSGQQARPGAAPWAHVEAALIGVRAVVVKGRHLAMSPQKSCQNCASGGSDRRDHPGNAQHLRTP